MSASAPFSAALCTSRLHMTAQHEADSASIGPQQDEIKCCGELVQDTMLALAQSYAPRIAGATGNFLGSWTP